MPAPTIKIANFCEMLTELMILSKKGFKDIHTISYAPGGEITGRDSDANLFGILYDSKNFNNVVAYAKINNKTGNKATAYFGYAPEQRNIFKLDSNINVRAYFPLHESPYVEVQITGNGWLNRYVIQNGQCRFM